MAGKWSCCVIRTCLQSSVSIPQEHTVTGVELVGTRHIMLSVSVELRRTLYAEEGPYPNQIMSDVLHPNPTASRGHYLGTAKKPLATPFVSMDSPTILPRLLIPSAKVKVEFGKFRFLYPLESWVNPCVAP